MVELRKRKAPAEPVPPPPSKKKSNPIKYAVSKAKAAVAGKKGASTNGTDSGSGPTVGSTIELEGFGGEIETNDGGKTSLKALVDQSKAGVVLFTYPKASTPGCKFSPTVKLSGQLRSISQFELIINRHQSSLHVPG